MISENPWGHDPEKSHVDGSLQVVANPCWEMALPDVSSAFLV